MVKLEMEKSGEPMSLSKTPTQLGVSVPMGGFRTFAAPSGNGSCAHEQTHFTLVNPFHLPGNQGKIRRASQKASGETTGPQYLLRKLEQSA